MTRKTINVLFVNDHLGYAGGITHGSTTYLSSVLPSFREHVRAGLCILRAWHPAAERFDGTDVRVEFLGRSKWDPRVLVDLLGLIRRWDIDIVHLNGQKAHLLGRLAARLLHRKAIVHLHMIYEPRPRVIQPWLARHTAAALGVSDALRRHAVEAFAIPETRAFTLYNGLRLDRFRPASRDRRASIRGRLRIPEAVPVAGVVGRITRTPDKGQRLAIEAMQRVRTRLPDSLLLVVGDGPARTECEALVRELGLEQAVRFLGHRDDVADIYAALDVVVVPSVVDEALGYSAVEAIASGRPVVAFGGGGLTEVVLDGETGLVVETGDVAGLADATTRLLSDESLRVRMGRSAHRHSENFALEGHVRWLESLYERLAE